MKMIFIFIDGFGIGEPDAAKNPIIAGKTPNLDILLGNGGEGPVAGINIRVFPTDAALGVPGLPQSATGQTAIFTGENAPRVLGRHLNGQPLTTLKKLIYKNNLFKELLKRNLKVVNSNVYREEYLNKMLDPKDRKHKPSTTSVMTLSAGLPFGRVEDYRKGNGVYHDITGQILIDSGYDVEPITPEQAAQRLYKIGRENDFTLYEHFMTDIIGHKMDMELAIKEIELLDSFLGEVLRLLDPEKDTLLIASDHGNIEDVSVKTHTFNKVPTILAGRIPVDAGIQIEALTDIMPAVLQLFDSDC